MRALYHLKGRKLAIQVALTQDQYRYDRLITLGRK